MQKYKTVLYPILTLIFIYIWIRLTDINSALSVIAEAKLHIIFLALIINLIQSLLSSYRLLYLFKIIKARLKFIDVWTGSWISSLVTSFLPFFSGGFVYSYLISKKAKISYIKSFSVVFIDFIINVSLLLSLGFIGMFYWKIGNPILYVGIIATLLIIGKYYLKKYKNIWKYINAKNIKIFATATGFGIATLLLSLVSWFMFFIAFGVKPDALQFSLAMGLFSILNLLPGAPLKVGQYELSGLLIFSYFLGLDKSLVSAIFLSQHVASAVVVLFFGIGSAYFTGFKLKNYDKK